MGVKGRQEKTETPSVLLNLILIATRRTVEWFVGGKEREFYANLIY
jgi:hypothetical protein